MADNKIVRVHDYPDDFWESDGTTVELITRDHPRAIYQLSKVDEDLRREVGRKFSPKHADALQELERSYGTKATPDS